MQFKREIKILAVLLTSAYTALVLAQAQPQQNGYGLGSGAGSVSATRTTTNSTGTATSDETAPSEITTMDPMDPARDLKAGSDATTGNRRDRRAMGVASGTAVPEPATSPRY